MVKLKYSYLRTYSNYIYTDQYICFINNRFYSLLKTSLLIATICNIVVIIIIIFLMIAITFDSVSTCLILIVAAVFLLSLCYTNIPLIYFSYCDNIIINYRRSDNNVQRTQNTRELVALRNLYLVY